MVIVNGVVPADHVECWKLWWCVDAIVYGVHGSTCSGIGAVVRVFLCWNDRWPLIGLIRTSVITVVTPGGGMTYPVVLKKNKH